MLEITLTGTWPQIRPMETLMAELAVRLGEDITKDVEGGGNPTWKNRVFPPGAANLAYIIRTLQLSSGNNFARASFGGGAARAYAMIQEMGGTITRTAKMVRFFWAKWYETHEQFWMNMALSKNAFITIPARPVVSGVYNRKEQYAKFIGQRIVITHSTPIGDTAAPFSYSGSRIV